MHAEALHFLVALLPMPADPSQTLNTTQLEDFFAGYPFKATVTVGNPTLKLDLHQRAGLDAGAHRAHVGIEGPHGHRHARRQTDLRRDFRREPAGFLVGRPGTGCVAIAEHRQAGIETGEEPGAGQSAPGLVKHGLVPRRTNTAGERVGIEIAGDKGRNEVGQFYPGVSGFEDLGRRPLAVQDLRPVPLAAIGAAALVEVFLANPLGLLRDLGRLGVAGVVFP